MKATHGGTRSILTLCPNARADLPEEVSVADGLKASSKRSTAPHGPVRIRATNRLQSGARNLFRFNAAHGLASAARGSFAQRSGLEPARLFLPPACF